MNIKKQIIAIFATYCLLISAVFAKSPLEFKINGVSDEILTNVESRLTALKKSYGKDLSIDQINSIYAQSVLEIKKALEPFGYFRSRVQKKLTRVNNLWTAEFWISLGAPVRISKIDFDIIGPGSNNPEFKRFSQELPISIGDTFQASVYDKMKTDLFQIAHNQGYVKAYLEENQIVIDLQKNAAVIILKFATGPLYYFGQVEFEANPYAPHFLSRFVPFRENEPFSSQKLIEFQQELSSSYYFQQVVVTPDFEHTENQRIPIKIGVTAPKSQRYSFGIGYGSYTGVRFTAGLSFRRLTATGQHFDAQLKLSSVLSGLAGKYYIPGKNPLTDQWVLGVNYQKFMPKNGTSNSGTFSAGYLVKKKEWQNSISINYLLERYKLKNEPTKQSHFLYPNWNFSYSHSDDLLHPTTGRSFSINLQGASSAILSSTNFLQAEIKGKYLFSPTSVTHIILRGDLGYTVVNKLDDLPLTLRFWAGGMNSIRGYGDSSIGPGKYLGVGSVELQNHIYGNWSGAVFYDFGTATNHFSGKLANSTGVGAIYDSMIGPVKFYLARALNKAGSGRHYGFEFNIGPEF